MELTLCLSSCTVSVLSWLAVDSVLVLQQSSGLKLVLPSPFHKGCAAEISHHCGMFQPRCQALYLSGFGVLSILYVVLLYHASSQLHCSA